MTRYKKALRHIHKIEKKYGSIANTPEDDTDLIAAQSLLNGGNEDVIELNIKILRLIEAGYPSKEIMRKLKIGHDKVEGIKDLNHVVFKPIFKYEVTKDDDEYISYSSTLQGLAKLADLTVRGSFEFISSKARAKGYQTKKVHLLWRDLPENCIYTIADKPLYIKYGFCSWLKYKILKWRD